MSTDVPGSRRQMLALLHAGPFRRYIIGSLISDSGTWMQWMAQGYVMSTLTDSAFMIGLATFATGIATIVFTPTGGSAADRSDKRKILIATQVAQIACAVALGWLVQTHQVHMRKLPDTQQTTYLAEKGTAVQPAVDEVIFVPIFSSETNEIIAALVVGFRPFELTGAH